MAVAVDAPPELKEWSENRNTSPPFKQHISNCICKNQRNYLRLQSSISQCALHLSYMILKAIKLSNVSALVDEQYWYSKMKKVKMHRKMFPQKKYELIEKIILLMLEKQIAQIARSFNVSFINMSYFYHYVNIMFK